MKNEITFVITLAFIIGICLIDPVIPIAILIVGFITVFELKELFYHLPTFVTQLIFFSMVISLSILSYNEIAKEIPKDYNFCSMFMTQ